jgi:uncharacterized membrane protein
MAKRQGVADRSFTLAFRRPTTAGVMGLVALVGLILIGYGFGQYRSSDWIEVWYPPRWTIYVTQILMWPASICVVAAYLRGDIWRKLKHPMLVGVKTWAVAHLVSNGDLGSIVLFGSFLGWAIYDRITLKRRIDPGAPPIPVGGRRDDVIALIGGTILYLALGLVFHPLVVGVPVSAGRRIRAPAPCDGDLMRALSPSYALQRAAE